MIKIIFGILAIALVGCGRGTSVPAQSDPAFAAYVQNFDTASAVYGIEPVTGKIRISFETLPAAETNEAGYCHHSNGLSETYIGIDSNQWIQMTESEKMTLIFHELGHCVLHEDHRTHSIMAPSILPGSEYLEHRAEYNAELFGEVDR